MGSYVGGMLFVGTELMGSLLGCFLISFVYLDLVVGKHAYLNFDFLM